MWEMDRMLLRDEISLDDHVVLETFTTDLHNVRLFSIPPQSLEVKSHTGIPTSGTQREAIVWKKLSAIQKKLKEKNEKVEREIMDLGLDVPRRYDPVLVKIGIQCLKEFYESW
jgi:hypothetical protein